MPTLVVRLSFFLNDTATTEIYTLSLHDALPICPRPRVTPPAPPSMRAPCPPLADHEVRRSEEHTSELQSLAYLVCRLLLEKKKRAPPSDPAHLQRRTGDSAHRRDVTRPLVFGAQ